MFTNLKPYPDYRESGSRMLGLVPTGWAVLPMRTLLIARTGRNRPDLPLLSVARERGAFVRGADDDNHNAIPEDLTGYKIALAGDLVINKMKAWQGSLGLAPCDGIVSPAYYVFEFAMSNRYFGQALLRSRPYVGEFAAASDGVRIGQWDLSVSRLRNVPVVVPPADQQAAIVKYLGHANARIDRAIAAKRKLIALLEEQKQAIINHAVTHGLDSSVPLKDSGIPWLGEIPAHWHVARIKDTFSCLNSLRVPLSSEQRGAMVSPQFDYYGASSVIDKVDGYLFDEPLILLAEDGANLVSRNLPLAILARGRYWVNNHAHILRPKFGNVEFLAHGLELVDYRPWISGAAQPKLTRDRLMAIPIAIPGAAEQVRIAEAVCEALKTPRKVGNRARREIELLREFRTRLTADVVTGQLDIRDAASRLPELEPADLVSDSGPDEDDLEAELAESLEEVDA